MYSGITIIYYRKTGAHVFTKPVKIEGTTLISPTPPSKLFYIVVHISAARRCECMYEAYSESKYRFSVKKISSKVS
jgi:hypothetical protein